MKKKLLIVAHFDDEILWFNPYKFDKIVVCFLGRDDKPGFDVKRLAVFAEHPLKEKMECLNINEQDDCAEKAINDYLIGNGRKFDFIHTHNSKGEYGHKHHLMVHSIVKRLFPDEIVESCLDNTNSKDRWFVSIKNIYLKYGCWTWKK